MGAVTLSHALFAVLLGAVTFAVARRSLRTGIAVALVSLVCAGSSLSGLTAFFLMARWGALFGFAALLLPRELGALGHAPRRARLLAVLPVAAFVSVAWSVEPALTLERAGALTLLIAISLALALAARRDGGMELVEGIAASAVVVLLLSLATVLVSPDGIANHQLQGLFQNPNGLGLYAGLTAPAVLAVLDDRGFGRWAPAAVAVAAAVTLASQSRSGMVALAIGVVAYELGSRSSRRLAATGSLVVACLVAGLLVVAVRTDNAAAQPSRVPRESLIERVTGARSEAWTATIHLIHSRPVLGYGFGTGDRLFARYRQRIHFAHFDGDNPNDGYLQLALEIGLVGFVPAIAAVAVGGVTAVIVGARRPLDRVESATAAILLASALVAVVESIFTSPGAPWAFLVWSTAAVVLVVFSEAPAPPRQPA